MRRDYKGDRLLIFCLLILAILMLLWAFKSTSYAAEIPEEQNAELFERTHWVDAIELSYEDAQLLMQIADAEAHNQGPDGEWLCMSCVVNRMRDNSGIWPDSLRAVVFEPFQFYTKGMKSEVSPEAHEALARIERGDVAPNIIGFEKSSSKVLEKYFSSAFTYRDHTFYTLKK